MPTTSPKLIPLPLPDVALINPQTGQPTKEFYDWLVRLQAVLTKVRTEIP